jgi:hypothetical protein
MHCVDCYPKIKQIVRFSLVSPHSGIGNCRGGRAVCSHEWLTAPPLAAAAALGGLRPAALAGQKGRAGAAAAPPGLRGGGKGGGGTSCSLTWPSCEKQEVTTSVLCECWSEAPRQKKLTMGPDSGQTLESSLMTPFPKSDRLKENVLRDYIYIRADGHRPALRAAAEAQADSAPSGYFRLR